MFDDAYFLDTAYVLGLFNVRDQWHERAVAWEEKIARENRRLVTTEFVLTEIANGFAAVKFRADAAKIIRALQESPVVEIVPATSELFLQGLELYESRADKDWGLTDCTSFVVMTTRGLTDALTSDEHFRQAGFRALLLENDF